MTIEETCGRCRHATPVLREKDKADTGFIRCAQADNPWLWNSRFLACDFTPVRFAPKAAKVEQP